MDADLFALGALSVGLLISGWTLRRYKRTRSLIDSAQRQKGVVLWVGTRWVDGAGRQRYAKVQLPSSGPPVEVVIQRRRMFVPDVGNSIDVVGLRGAWIDVDYYPLKSSYAVLAAIFGGIPIFVAIIGFSS